MSAPVVTITLVLAVVAAVTIALIIAIRRSTRYRMAAEREAAKRVHLSIVRDADADVEAASEWSANDAWKKAVENFDPDE